MSEIKIQTLEEKADDFAYISLKIQAEMYDTDKNFYGFECTVERISLCILSCANENRDLLKSVKNGILNAFNRLKNEQNLPILSYETISKVVQFLDKKLEGEVLL